MDVNRNKHLEKKYWEGSTTLEEEQELRNRIAENSQGLSNEIRVLFDGSAAAGNAKLGDDFDASFWADVEKSTGRKRTLNVSHFLRYAAVGIVLLGLAAALWNVLLQSDPNPKSQPIETAQTDTYTDPQAAFEETKRALTFAASKLNKGKEPITEIKRFYDVKVSISGMENAPEPQDSTNAKQ